MKTEKPEKSSSEGLQMIARGIRLLVLDVDGVLTNGQVCMDYTGQDLVSFHVHDGAAIKFAQRAGLIVAWISGRPSDAVRMRAQQLQVTEIHQGIRNKVQVLSEILHRHNLDWDSVAVMGDDIPDLPMMMKAALAAAPADAVDEVLNCAHFTAPKPGGEGAVRALIEFILKAQDRWHVLPDRSAKN